VKFKHSKAVAQPALNCFGGQSFDLKRATIFWLGHSHSKAQNNKIC